MLSLRDPQSGGDSGPRSLSLRVPCGCIIKKIHIFKNPSLLKIELHDWLFNVLLELMKTHKSLSWLTVDAKVTSSRVMFTQNAVVDGKPFQNSLFRPAEGSYHSIHMKRLVRKGCLDPQPKTNLNKALIYRAVRPWNSSPINI